MTPAQFLARVKRKEIPPVCLFLGQESYNRKRCREALAVVLKIEIEQYDAAETSLAAIIDDARAMSLFVSERLIFVTGAETLMPRTPPSRPGARWTRQVRKRRSGAGQRSLSSMVSWAAS